MDDSKNPPENSYGQRNVVTLTSNKTFTDLASVLSSESKYNGHINRNIRVQLALIDMAKPYVQITQVTQLKSGQMEVKFQINGCTKIDSVTASVNQTSALISQTTGFCNWSPVQSQTQFTVNVTLNSTLTVEAVVD